MASGPVDRSSDYSEFAGELVRVDVQPATRSWYFTKDEIDNHSPSRKDGIDRVGESLMRKSFCSFLKELGIKLRVSPVTTATAMMFCHRFYMRQSFAKNDWQTIATACMFLACKVEENLHPLRNVVVVAYEIVYKWDPSAPGKIRQLEVYHKQQELILNAEHLLLVTIAFDMNIQHPFKPLLDALKKLKISNNDVAKAAWYLLNEWLRTTLCLQYKPPYIAAASLSVAAKLLNFRLPMVEGMAWWMHFDISPKQLQEVTQQMLRYFKHDGKKKVTPSYTNEIKATLKVKNETSQRTQSSEQSGLTVGSDMEKEAGTIYVPNPKTFHQGMSKVKVTQAYTNEIKAAPKVENGTSQMTRSCEQSSLTFGSDMEKEAATIYVRNHKTFHQDDADRIDIGGLRGVFEMAKRVKHAKYEAVVAAENEGTSDLLIERELEKGVELDYLVAGRKTKVV